MFFVGASVYIISAVFFILFGTANTQPWNYGEQDRPGTEKTNNGDLKDLNGAQAKNEDPKNVKETPLSVIS